MNDAQTIIETLKKRGMTYASIGAAIGTSRESVSRIAHGHQNGELSLPALRNLVSSASTSTRQAPPSRAAARPRKQSTPEYIEADYHEVKRRPDVPPEETTINIPSNVTRKAPARKKQLTTFDIMRIRAIQIARNKNQLARLGATSLLPARAQSLQPPGPSARTQAAIDYYRMMPQYQRATLPIGVPMHVEAPPAPRLAYRRSINPGYSLGHTRPQ